MNRKQNFSSAKRGNRKTKRQRKGKSGGGYTQRATGRYHYTPAIGPKFAPKIPNELSVSLVNTDFDSHSVASGFALRRFGIVEFLAYRPLYCLELYQIYKYCRVTAVTVQLKLVNTSATVPIVLALGQCPYADSAGLTPDRAWESIGTKRSIISVQGGMDRTTMSKTFVGQDCYGQPYLDQKYWVNASQSASTTPIDADEPIGYYMISDYSGQGAFSCKIEFKMTYHLQFFDLRIPSSSIHQQDDVADFQTVTHSSAPSDKLRHREAGWIGSMPINTNRR